jgi:hypothetical protein
MTTFGDACGWNAELIAGCSAAEFGRAGRRDCGIDNRIDGRLFSGSVGQRGRWDCGIDGGLLSSSVGWIVR